jgi:hypothetical protein
MNQPRSEKSDQGRYFPRSLKWGGGLLVLLVLFIGVKSDQEREAADKMARPDYYAHIDQFGDPLTINEVRSYLNGIGYQDLDLSFVKGPKLISDGWLLGVVFKSVQNPNDQLWWFVKTGKRGVQDIKMYPGKKFPIPAYP